MRRSTAKWFKRAKAGAVLVGLLVVWIVAAPLLADALVIERPMVYADAIVILSGSADHAQRAKGGAEAFKRGVAPKLILTDDGQRGGWDDSEKRNPYFVERTARELKAFGVPSDVIEQMPPKVDGTGDEAELIVTTAGERGYRRLLIVTSDFHSRRALWTFEKAAADRRIDLSIGMSPAPPGPGYPDRLTWWLTPRGWRSVGAEYVKFAYYWLFY